MRWQLQGWSISSLTSPHPNNLLLEGSLRLMHSVFCQTLKITKQDKKGQGGGVAEEGELIDVVDMGVEEVRMQPANILAQIEMLQLIWLISWLLYGLIS